MDEDFETAIKEEADYLNITLNTDLIKNVIKLRHIVASGQSGLITGQTGIGKTTVWKVSFF